MEARAALQAQPRAQVTSLIPCCGSGLHPHIPSGFPALFPGKPPCCFPNTLPSASRLSITLKKQVLPLVVPAPPGICVWRSITTIPWCSKVRGCPERCFTCVTTAGELGKFQGSIATFWGGLWPKPWPCSQLCGELMVQTCPCRKNTLNPHLAAAFLVSAKPSSLKCMPRSGEGCLGKEPAGRKLSPQSSYGKDVIQGNTRIQLGCLRSNLNFHSRWWGWV